MKTQSQAKYQARRLSFNVQCKKEADMKAIIHMKIAGALQIVLSIPLLLLFSAMLQGYPPELFLLIPNWMYALVLLAGGVEVFFGISLLKQKKWVGGPGGFICCFPGFFLGLIGTVISVYTLWVLIMQVNNNVRRN